MTVTEKRPLRVLYVAHAANLTGASRSLLDLLGHLDRERVEPVVLVGRAGPLEGRLDGLGVEHHRIPYISATDSPRERIPSGIKRMIRAAAQPAVDAFVADGDFDLVHSNSVLVDVGMRAARKARIPYVNHVREFVAEDHDLRFANEPEARELMQGAAETIFISGPVERKFAPWLGGAPFVTVHNGIDASSYEVKRSAPLFAEPPVKMLLTGRLSPNKGHLEAIKAVDMLRSRGIDARLTLAGGGWDGAYGQECKTYIREHRLGTRVRVLDFVDDVNALRAESDISLTCSINEAMGRVTIEGMLAGCLAVAADDAAAQELVEDGVTGYLYEQGNPESLADVVQKAAARPEHSREVAAAGHAYAVEAFDIQAYADTMCDLYDEVLARAESGELATLPVPLEPPAPDDPLYAFVVLHYGQSDLTRACVASLLALEGPGARVGVVVVDNGSPDGSGAALRAEWSGEPRVRVLLMGENAGFSRANNAGYRLAVAEFSPWAVAVLNNDTEVRQADFLAVLASDLDTERYYVVGPDVYVERKGVHQSPLIDHVMSTAEEDHVIDVLSDPGYQAKAENEARRMRWPLYAKANDVQRRIVNGKRPEPPAPPVFVRDQREGVTLHGAALVFTDLFIATGQDPFSPEVFMYGEEYILAKRCQQNGWPVLYDPRLQVIHYEKAATDSAYDSYVAKRLFFRDRHLDSMAVLKAMGPAEEGTNAR